jgi:multidrug efflux pump subunit AcrB
VGYLVFKSDTRSLGEIQDLALNRVRPQFATLPGLTSPPPFGGSQRTIVIRVDPDRLRSYGMAPDDVIRAVTTENVIMPSGSVNIGEETRISPMNSVVGPISDLLELPIRTGAGTPVFIRDVGSVSDSYGVRPGEWQTSRLYPRHQAPERLDIERRERGQGESRSVSGAGPR